MGAASLALFQDRIYPLSIIWLFEETAKDSGRTVTYVQLCDYVTGLEHDAVLDWHAETTRLAYALDSLMRLNCSK